MVSDRELRELVDVQRDTTRPAPGRRDKTLHRSSKSRVDSAPTTTATPTATPISGVRTPQPPVAAKPPRKWLRVLGVLAAVAIVLGSIVVAGQLVLGELEEEPQASTTTVVATPVPTEVPAPPTPQPFAADSPGDPFGELRYLPAGDVPGLSLSTVVAQVQATPLIALTRTDGNGILTGAVFIDRASREALVGLDVAQPRTAQIGSATAEVAETGPLGQLISLSSPSAGEVTSWGVGISDEEHVRVLNAVEQRFEDPAASLPQGWSQIGQETAARQGVWRGYFQGVDGEIAVVESTRRLEAPPCMTAGSAGCEFVASLIDDDGISVSMFGSQDRVEGLLALVRGTGATNARVTRTELRPYVSVDPADARDLLFLPALDSEWTAVDGLAYWSGETVTEPALVLIEREVPEIGDIVSAAVVHIGVTDDPSAATVSDAGIGRHVVELEETTADIRTWQHTEEEIEALAELITVADEGFDFASRAAGSLGLERRYEPATVNPIPETITEAIVFVASVVDQRGADYSVRVSKVASFEPEAAAAMPHLNDRVTLPVRGQTASLQVTADGITLSWEEQPGTLITIEGPIGSDYEALAESLVLASPAEVAALANE